MRCSSSLVPSVTVTSACVSPRVKSAEPCVRGSTPASPQMSRTSSNLRPSGRRCESSISSRKIRSLRFLKTSSASTFCSSGTSARATSCSCVDAGVAFELGVFLRIQRVGQFVADLLLDRCVEFLVEFRSHEDLLRLARRRNQLLHGRRRSSSRFRGRIRARREFRLPIPAERRLPPCRCHRSLPAMVMLSFAARRLLISRIDDVLAIHHADANRADDVVERNIRNGERGAGADDARARQDRYPGRPKAQWQ